MGQTVFNNEMTVHVWAQMSQPYGRNQGDSLSFNGGELVSYNTAVALHYGDFVLVSKDTFSTTTAAKHMAHIWRSVDVPLIYVDDIFAWGERYHYKRDYPKGGQLKKVILASILKLSQSYERRKRDSTRARDWNDIQAELENLRFICDRFGLKYPKGYSDASEALGQTAATVARLEKARKAEERKRKKAAQALRDEQQYNFNQWLEGDDLPSGRDGERRLVSCPYVFQSSNPAQMTVYKDTVYTTGRAEAPLAHVIKAFKLYHRVVKSGESWEKNGERARLGHFELDKIDSQGNAKIGCHYFTAEELERFYNKWIA